jgi:hypothetical protein
MRTVQLRAEHGDLYVGEHPLLYVYPAGDCDVADWPLTMPRVLCGALYDAREMGLIPIDTVAAILPDGTRFEITDQPDEDPLVVSMTEEIRHREWEENVARQDAEFERDFLARHPEARGRF